MPGIDMSCEEEKAVAELQVRMKKSLTPNLQEDDTLFYRFLKARDFDVDRAEKMLQKHITWRKINQSETILEDFKPTEVFVKYYDPTLLGHAKDGSLVLFSPVGNYNIHEVLKTEKVNSFMKEWAWFGEKHTAYIKEQRQKGSKAYQVILIMDLHNLTLGNATSKLSLNLFLRFLQTYQDNFPERLKSLFVINAPSYYVFAYSILKVLMSSAMLKKIHILAYNGWKEQLLQAIDADVLPAFLGGNRTDPDGNPLCKTFVVQGGTIPEKYFLTDEERYFNDKSRVKKIKVFSSKKEEICIEVKEAGLVIQWEFLVKGKDIGFGLYYEDSEEELQELIPVNKRATLDGTDRDTHKCRVPGKYIIIFDNTYSWMSAKEIEYCITVLNPEK